MREVLWYLDAVEDMTRIAATHGRVAHRTIVAVRAFGKENRGDLKKLQGSQEWRLRVPDWRVIMLLSGSLTYVTEVDNRRDAY